MPTIAELQPYFAAVGALFGVATRGFVVRIALLIRDAEKQRTAIVEERLTSTQEDLARTEKWSEREKQQLTAENEGLRRKLADALSRSGVTMHALASGASLEQAQETIHATVGDLLRRMESAERASGGIGHPAWHLELAKGYMAKRDWGKAALHFDTYVEFDPTDSEIQFSRGVAHANARTDTLSSLRAYNEAIAFAPASLDDNMRARHFAYRGAMLKRMDRLAEAESDLKLALSIASRDYEIHDIKYNLAAVYAMWGKRAEMMACVEELKGHDRELAAIRYHLKDYFARFASDPEFLAIVSADLSI